MKRRSARPFTVEVKNTRPSRVALADTTTRPRESQTLWWDLPTETAEKPAVAQPPPPPRSHPLRPRPRRAGCCRASCRCSPPRTRRTRRRTRPRRSSAFRGASRQGCGEAGNQARAEGRGGTAHLHPGPGGFAPGPGPERTRSGPGRRESAGRDADARDTPVPPGRHPEGRRALEAAAAAPPVVI